MKKRIIGMVCLLLCAADALAASHWTVNPHGFQYDMAVYAVIQVNGKAVVSYDDYEVAAFCEGDCRGVAKVLKTEDNSRLLYLRIYSNVTQDESISLKVYRKSKDEEVLLPEKLDFVADAMLGTPGEPFTLTLSEILHGDINGDGTVDESDYIGVANHILGKTPAGFNAIAADVNGDGVIDISDYIGIANIILTGSIYGKK